MKESRPLLSTLSLMLTCVCVPQNVLTQYLPQTTFPIYDVLIRRGPAPSFPSPVRALPIRTMAPFPEVFPQRVVPVNSQLPRLPPSWSSNRPTFSGAPLTSTTLRVPNPTRLLVPRRQPTFQPRVPQSVPSPQNQFRPLGDSGNRQVHPGNAVPRPNSGRKPIKRHPMCGVLPNTGDCRAAFPRYYYNNKTDQCDCFLYGGCGGSALEYSYSNLEDCLTTCVPFQKEEGPTCKEIFREEDVYFDPVVTNPPRPIPTSSQSLPKPETSDLSDEYLLFLLANSISPKDLVNYDRDEDDERNQEERRNLPNF